MNTQLVIFCDFIKTKNIQFPPCGFCLVNLSIEREEHFERLFLHLWTKDFFHKMSWFNILSLNCLQIMCDIILGGVTKTLTKMMTFDFMTIFVAIYDLNMWCSIFLCLYIFWNLIRWHVICHWLCSLTWLIHVLLIATWNMHEWQFYY